MFEFFLYRLKSSNDIVLWLAQSCKNKRFKNAFPLRFNDKFITNVNNSKFISKSHAREIVTETWGWETYKKGRKEISRRNVKFRMKKNRIISVF